MGRLKYFFQHIAFCWKWLKRFWKMDHDMHGENALKILRYHILDVCSLWKNLPEDTHQKALTIIPPLERLLESRYYHIPDDVIKYIENSKDVKEMFNMSPELKHRLHDAVEKGDKQWTNDREQVFKTISEEYMFWDL